MPEATLEALTRRVEELERKLTELTKPAPAQGWRAVVGMFEETEFMRQVDAEAQAIREASRQAAAEGRFE